MDTDRSAVRALLNEYLPVRGPITTDAAMRRLEPFFERAERGSYDLARAGDAPVAGMRQAIKCVAGSRSLHFGFEPISFSALAAKAGAQATKEGRDAAWNDVVGAANPLFRQMLAERYDAKLSAYLGTLMRERVEEVIWPSLVKQVWTSFQENRWDAATQHFKLEVRAVVIEAIEYFVGFAIAGDIRPFQEMDGIVATLPSAITIGLKEGTKDTFITLVD